MLNLQKAITALLQEVFSITISFRLPSSDSESLLSNANPFDLEILSLPILLDGESDIGCVADELIVMGKILDSYNSLLNFFGI